MFLHLGGSVSVRDSDIIAILDIDKEATPQTTKEFLSAAEKNGKVLLTSSELPKSVILTDDGQGDTWVIFSHISSKSLCGRAKQPY